jgi:hypothetical protein
LPGHHCDLIAKVFQAAPEIPGGTLLIQLVEPGLAQLAVVNPARQHVAILVPEVASLGARAGHRRLEQHRAQIFVGMAHADISALARAFMAGRANAGP